MRVFTLNRMLLFVLLAAVGLNACSHYRDFYFVRNAGAMMPVKISGKANSSTYLILLPGGPSGDGMAYQTLFKLFKKDLETQYKLVYYDQRGAANVQGRYERKSLNLDQLGQDLYRLVRIIHDKDQNARIFLLGYSYGGTLGATYLLNPSYQSEVAGFISISGAFDRVNQQAHQQQLVEYLLKHWVKEGFIDNYEPMKTGFTCQNASDPVVCRTDSLETVTKINNRLEGLGDYNKFPVNLKTLGRLLQYAFFSQSNPIYTGIAESQNASVYGREFNQHSTLDQLEKIRVPVLLINGLYDTNVPYFEMDLVLSRLGTPMAEKSKVLLEESGHLPMLTEPKLLAQKIVDFVEKH